jgi:metal-dependent HD superfamily phosphatase/phosphodiesterase
MDMFPQTTKQRKRLWIYSLARKNSKDIQPIVSSHVEAVVLLSRETDPRMVEVGMEAETGEGKRVNYTGKA